MIREQSHYFIVIVIIIYFYTSFQLESARHLASVAHHSHTDSQRCALTRLHSDLPIETRNAVSCDKIAIGDETEIQLSLLKKLTYKDPKKKGVSSSWPDKDLGLYIGKRGCAYFKASRNFLPTSPTAPEDDYPLAYSIVVHRGAGQVERLLRAIYRPQNQYCIHVDAKSTDEFYATLSTLADCFDNVFLASKRVDVIYAHYSRLQADLNCMDELLERGAAWKYLINLCGQDFPLKTNSQMVTYLKYLHPYHSIETFQMPEHKLSRYRNHFEIRSSGEHERALAMSDRHKNANPLSTALFGGSAYIVATREFIAWARTNQTVLDFFDWSRDTYSPDEMIWATLTRLPGAPGWRHQHQKWDQNELQTVTRIVKWMSLEEGLTEKSVYPKCTGYHRHGICVYGIGDVSWLLNRDHFFGNKFDDSRLGDDGALQCLESTLRKFERGEACDPQYEYDRALLDTIE